MMLGPATMFAVYSMSVLLHVLIPARKYTQGYCCDQTTFRPLFYKLNGFIVLLGVLIAFFFVLPIDLIESLWVDYWSSVFAANVLGMGLSTAVFINGGSEKYLRCLTTDQIANGKPKAGTALAHGKQGNLSCFFLGCKWNPRYFGIDFKMVLYLVGAVGLACNILACLVVHLKMTGGSISTAMLVYVGMSFWFIAEYLLYEHVHTYTYDLFAEKIGFKLIWGCLVFYPYFYAIGCYSLVYTSPVNDISPLTSLLIFIIFLTGWIITRGANLQKYEFKVNPKRDRFCFLFGLIVVPQHTVPSSRLLFTGWWGVARHFNYFGEIVQGVALALPGFLVSGNDSTLYRMAPLLYPLYYIILFATRVIDDDAVCQTKYGTKWEEYCSIVPWRICPKVW